MEQIRSELDKLISFTEGKEGITAQDVEEICTQQTAGRIFEMLEAVAAGRERQALELYYDLLALKEPSMRILFLLARQMNQLLTVKDLMMAGQNRDGIEMCIRDRSKIISDLLALVKLDKAATEMNLDQVNINELVEGILKRLRPIAEKRNIELVLESFRPITAEVDEVKLSLAITNLVENAIKYNKDDGWVHVSLNADHKYFFVKVADSGVGIPEDAAQHIFERFYRVDKARSRETGGTGLGLAITQNVINLHHGAIKMYSRAGEGSTFMMRIPLSYIA